MPNNATVDLLGRNGKYSGDIAAMITNAGSLNIGKLKPFIDPKDGRAKITFYKGGDPLKKESYVTVPVNNATLRRDEWKALDDAVLAAARYRLGGIDDLIANGLTYNLGNALGTTVLEWHDMSDGMEAVVTMDGVTRSQGDRPNFQTNYLPIPVIHSDYEINARALAASRNMGNPLDTVMAEQATRRIKEKLEDMLFTDTTYAFGTVDDRNRNKIYSYLNHPDRNLVTLGDHWDASAGTGAKIIADIMSMKASSLAARHFGPWQIYIPSLYEIVLDGDYDATTNGSTDTIRQRIMKIEGIKGIKIIDTLPANNVVMVQMTSDVVRLIQGLGIQNVEWDTEGKWITKFKVITIQVPQIRSDQNGRSGIVHLAA